MTPERLASRLEWFLHRVAGLMDRHSVFVPKVSADAYGFHLALTADRLPAPDPPPGDLEGALRELVAAAEAYQTGAPPQDTARELRLARALAGAKIALGSTHDKTDR